jgi:ribose-phosphate pyrophosphokinase
MHELLIVGCVSDNPFVNDIIQHLNHQEDYSDIISLKNFLNTEFCPRFIVNESSWENIGNKLAGKYILIVSNSVSDITRNDLAMRNCLIARAAKDNGAERVILLEPDLYYSAQDRGPRKEHGLVGFTRTREDYKKFDGQPFSARLYADLLAKSGVDEVVTVHNHSCSVKSIFLDRFSGGFHNLTPYDVYSSYIVESDVVNDRNLVLCAPDSGAVPFALEVQEMLGKESVPLMVMAKERTDERGVRVHVSKTSDVGPKEISGRDVVVVDDMVRTGNTIVETCKLIREYNPNKVVFFVTHFYSSREGRINLNDPAIDEIVTTNTIPQILNRDMQGRLRSKMVVLLLERWISNYLIELVGGPSGALSGPLYREDMSSKNPRWKGKMGPLFSVQ